ncbi:hypothetical protein [Chryseobacterium sp.]|uniref:hypothetical protein n=1 Tax=Chryseobacterium sp. TaxID=1871047 RepID=UPI0012A7FDFA|nr:hypothetical protein [Chryseobacterium sp.]QFG53924.1 hypothetical protein F7R58_10305 [Chryseobacterium sp.]
MKNTALQFIMRNRLSHRKIGVTKAFLKFWKTLWQKEDLRIFERCAKAFSLPKKPSTHLRISKIPSGKQAFRGNFANPRSVSCNCYQTHAQSKMTERKQSFFNNTKSNSLLIILIFIFAFISAKSTESFRISDYRWVYQTGIYLCYIFHYIALISCVINLYLVIVSKTNESDKLLFSIINSIPLLFWIYIFLQN